MTLSDLESIGSFVGGIAVVFSFVFLALQMRQSARTTASSAMGAWLGDYNSMLLKISGDAGLSTLVREGLSDFKGRSLNDQMRFHTFICQMLLSCLYLFNQRMSGTFDQQMADQVLNFTAGMFKMPGGQQWWSIMRELTAADFVAYMDGLIADSPPIDSAMPWFLADANAIMVQPTSS